MRFFVLLLLCLTASVFAHVVQTDSLEPLKATIPDLNAHDLVIFDYERTLFMADDALLQSCGKKCLHIRIHGRAPHLDEEKVEELISIILLTRKASLLDPESPQIVRTLQGKGVKTMVLTALHPGPFGKIPKKEEWRLQELSSHGYDFQASFPHLSRIEFKGASPPIYLKGVFCCGSYSKGKALHAFLKKVKFQPRRIIFIDNAADHHDSVGKLARRLKLPYLGYHYTAGLKKRKNIDEQIANYQIEYLIEHEVWLSDEEARWKSTPI